MSKQNRLNDTTLRWLYKTYRAERDKLPEDERVGFRVWCRSYGILTPDQEKNIAHREVPLKQEGYEDNE